MSAGTFGSQKLSGAGVPGSCEPTDMGFLGRTWSPAETVHVINWLYISPGTILNLTKLANKFMVTLNKLLVKFLV